MKKIILLFSILILRADLFAQEMLGISNSNYAGVSGLYMNPATIVDSRLRLDINLVSGGVSFNNDYLYIPKQNLKFFGFRNIVDQIREKNYKERDASESRNMTLASMVQGPSVMFRVKDNSFAVSTAARAFVSVKDLNNVIAKFAYEDEGVHYKPLHGTEYNSGPLNLGLASWSELGISYGREIMSKEANYIKGALTIKHLWGYAAFYVQGDNVRFRVDEDSLQNLYYQVTADMEYGHSYSEKDDNSAVNGTGWGFDLGFAYEYRPDYANGTYTMDGKTLNNPQINKYKLRIGLSLLDIGKINFDSKNSKALDMRGAYASWTDNDSNKIENVTDFDTTNSNYFFGTPYGSQKATKFDMALPTALSLQADYKAWKNIYVNATWIQSIKRSIPGVQRASMISLTPRYEYNWFEVAMPLSLYEYDVFRMGLALRLASFFIGSDQLGSVLGISDLGGMDFYMGLKFSIAGAKISDRDGDGVSDKRDLCKDVYGLLAFEGCPDRDGDGIQDSQDDCPDVKGLARFKGCPDTDGDGVEDRVDQCPDVPGLIEFNGCPDFDHDGIIDSLDACPRDSGLAMFNGCPDTDSDSIPDVEDDCPLIAGPLSNKGCPVITKAAEPKIPVVVALTEEEKEIINKVFTNLEFETGKAVIRSSSFASLNELAELLKRKTNYKLNIDGHTDNVGNKSYNQKLSENRADAVKMYLTEKSIDASRIIAKGYGMTRPIANNNTPEGRQRNRRVEFTILE